MGVQSLFLAASVRVRMFFSQNLGAFRFASLPPAEVSEGCAKTEIIGNSCSSLAVTIGTTGSVTDED